MNQQAQDTYLRMQVNTAAPWELTAMLYNGCIKFMKQAKQGIQSKNYEGKNINIQKSIDILDELLSTLKMEYDVSKRLFSLYEYMKNRLFQANIQLNESYIQECIELMTELKETWIQSMKQLHTQSKVQAQS
ncbi:flagellar export chaperone FliS [Cohnella sp. GCM10020058]|uniref:flagellar export chaperone FliS n=1 Tax=Cohnella sp. GCM10020058 TaxID=3317330 RepID=UPI003645BE50